MERGIEFDIKGNPKMPYNTLYLNLSLLDELDYVIGSYGQPNQAFIFTANSFAFLVFVINLKGN